MFHSFGFFASSTSVSQLLKGESSIFDSINGRAHPMWGMSASERAEVRAGPTYECSMAWYPARSARRPAELRVSSPRIQARSASGYQFIAMI